MHGTGSNGGRILEVLAACGTSSFVNFEGDVEIPNACFHVTLNVSEVKLRDLLQPRASVGTDQRYPVSKRFLILRVRVIRTFKQLRHVIIAELLVARAATLRLLAFGEVLIRVALAYSPLKERL